MPEITKKERRVVRHTNYNGVCHNCNSPIFAKEITGIEIFNNLILAIVFPLDELKCPYCLHDLYFIQIYNNLNVTQEIKSNA